MRMFFTKGILPVLILALSAPAASADPVTILSSTRVVHIEPFDPDDQAFDSDILVLSQAVPPYASATAALNSRLDPTNFNGTGSTEAAVTGVPYHPEITVGSTAGWGYETSFQVTTAQAFRLSATFLLTEVPPDSTGTSGHWQVGLANSSGTPFYAGPANGSSTHVIDVSGVLPAGIYQFLVRTSVGAFAPPGELGRSSSIAGQFSLALSDASVSPVPEPGSLLLLATGLAGVWRMRRANAARRDPAACTDAL